MRGGVPDLASSSFPFLLIRHLYQSLKFKFLSIWICHRMEVDAPSCSMKTLRKASSVPCHLRVF
ncbi:hypothetical protein CY34DRAFT_814001, partial [Suillus luteus UH-Slu-Lm8-n1]